jgi:hypothetical protein
MTMHGLLEVNFWPSIFELLVIGDLWNSIECLFSHARGCVSLRFRGQIQAMNRHWNKINSKVKDDYTTQRWSSVMTRKLRSGLSMQSRTMSESLHFKLSAYHLFKSNHLSLSSWSCFNVALYSLWSRRIMLRLRYHALWSRARPPWGWPSS